MPRRHPSSSADSPLNRAAPAPSDRSHSERAYRLLEEVIVTQKVAPGSIVSEAHLSELIGMGRMPTREAVRRLARENLLEVRPKYGVVIHRIDPDVQLRLLAIRREVERLMVRLVVRECDAAINAAFDDLARDFQAAAQRRDIRLFVHADKIFNELCLQTCGNEFVVDAMRLMQGPSRRFWFQRARDTEILVETASLHAALAAAIAQGEPDTAIQASDRLLDSAEQFARRAIEQAMDTVAVR
ncbi:GntR family transcriptional regulator [Caballeronia sp. DA-9]|uniref:GntR family transcriptional regulator n=1 Tax=Caballeronia sp. DA-9 TaxID=3436237 RepID=UPI003F679977